MVVGCRAARARPKHTHDGIERATSQTRARRRRLVLRVCGARGLEGGTAAEVASRGGERTLPSS